MSRGYTLTEAIIATFLLIASLMVAARLFHSSMRYGVWIENKALASVVAEKRMAELRRWADTHSGWAGYPTGNDPNFPIYTVTTRLENATLASPSTSLEAGFSAPRTFTSSLRQAIVEVTWDSGGGPNNSVVLTSLLRDPRRGWRAANPVVISGAIPPSVGPATTVTFTAQGFHPGGAIDDLCFSWSVEPEFPNAGLGTITPAHDGRSAVFTNQLNVGGGTIASAGQCRVVATAVYGGQERRGASAVITLTP